MTMMNNSWYDTIEADEELTQGDLILCCPVLTWKADVLEVQQGGHEEETLRSCSLAVSADVIVMTQACDLEQGKVTNVLLCPHVSLREYRMTWEDAVRTQNQNPTDRAWSRHCDEICKGFIWNLAMLNARENVEHLQTEHRIVDFSEVYTTPRAFLESLIRQRAQPRLRLRSPYREYLSQAFARFFMRVGLPVPVSKSW